MTNHRKSVLINAGFEIIYEVLFECATEIVNELESRVDFGNNYIIKRGNCGKHIPRTLTKNGTVGHGCPFSQGTHNEGAVNNRGLYFWICVVKNYTDKSTDNTECKDKNPKDKDKNPEHYCIALSFTEISEETNYPIIQIGKFQFWKEICCAKCNSSVSPHEIIKIADKDITMVYKGSNSFDPEQAIFNNTYDTVELVNKFMDFMK